MYKPIPNRLRSFKAHALKEGCEVLNDDLHYINEQLAFYDTDDFKAILRRYLAKWHEGMGRAEKTAQKQNLGRKFANTYLREEAEAEFRKKPSLSHLF